MATDKRGILWSSSDSKEQRNVSTHETATERRVSLHERRDGGQISSSRSELLKRLANMLTYIIIYK